MRSRLERLDRSSKGGFRVSSSSRCREEVFGDENLAFAGRGVIRPLAWSWKVLLG